MNTYEQRRYDKSKRHCGVKNPYTSWAFTPDQWRESLIEHATKGRTVRKSFDKGQGSESEDSTPTASGLVEPPRLRNYRVRRLG